MRYKIYNSIIFKVTLALIIMVAIGAVSLYYSIVPSTKDELQSLVQKSQLSFANYIASDIDRQIIKREDIVDTLSKKIPTQLLNHNNKQQLKEWLDFHSYNTKVFKLGIVVVSVDGEVLVDSIELKNRKNLNYLQKPWFQKAIESDEVVISTPFLGEVSKKPMMNIAKVIKDSKNRAIAVVYGAMLLNDKGFMQFVYENKIGDSGGFLVISPNDEIFVASSNPDMVLKKTPPKGVNLLHDRAMAGYRGTGVTKNAYDVVELSAMASIESTGWFLVVRMPIDEAYKPIRNINDKIIDSMFINLVLFTIILVVVMLYLLKPIKNYSKNIRDMADSKKPLTTLDITNKDEVSQMAMGFNMLVKRVKDDMHTKDKLAQMGEMLSIIAHQWKQPLSVISSISSTTRLKNTMATLESKEIAENMDDIGKQIDFMADTIDEFRHFFNPNKEKKLEDLNLPIETAISLLLLELQNKKIEITKDINLPTKIYTLSNELIQVLLNLIKNAKEQFSDEIEDKYIKIIGYEDENYSYIIIKDNAGGIAENMIDKIFDKYFSTKGEKKGTGIGLDLCKTIIEKNCNGKISVENSDKGAKFTIRLDK
jgi:C4-dicarboxylate-specific signal transduction histidine kinase